MAVALAGSPFLRHLEGLYLNGNPIGEEGTLALTRVAREAGIPLRGDNNFWVEPDRSRREPFRQSE